MEIFETQQRTQTFLSPAIALIHCTPPPSISSFMWQPPSTFSSYSMDNNSCRPPHSVRPNQQELLPPSSHSEPLACPAYSHSEPHQGVISFWNTEHRARNNPIDHPWQWHYCSHGAGCQEYYQNSALFSQFLNIIYCTNHFIPYLFISLMILDHQWWQETHDIGSTRSIAGFTTATKDYTSALSSYSGPISVLPSCQEYYKNSALFAQFLSYPHNLWIVILFSSPLLC